MHVVDGSPPDSGSPGSAQLLGMVIKSSDESLDKVQLVRHNRDMTTTGTTATRYYVARETAGTVTIGRYRTARDAKVTATTLYSLGVIAPLDIAAADLAEAKAKASACWSGRITTAQARNARYHV